MKRSVVSVGTGLVAAAVVLVLCGCGKTEQTPASTSRPTSDNSSLSTTGPTGEPTSSYWTDEKLQCAQPEKMPTEP